jgi:predicted transcriptional regulator
MPDTTIPFRQNAIVDHMYEKEPYSLYRTNEVARDLGTTTNAILAAFKRMRTVGLVELWGDEGQWRLTEKGRQLGLNRHYPKPLAL